MEPAAASLLDAEPADVESLNRLLAEVGFSDPEIARRRLMEMCPDADSRAALRSCLPMLLVALSEAASPDGSLVNFERYVQSVDDRVGLFLALSQQPRIVEILIKLFVGSQFLTEILLRNPHYLQELTAHKRIAEFKSRSDFFDEASAAVAACDSAAARLNALRRYQHWELLRIGACDTFGLMDMKSVTLQLSLLADSLVQASLAVFAEELNVSLENFVVLAFGKLGGEELNFSSDIDLVFLSETDATPYWPLGQKLIKSLTEATPEGFLYRVDMRLRPWGKSGALVNTVDAHVQYLKQHGLLWEKQALLKARPIAGNLDLGQRFLQRIEPLIYDVPAEAVRQSIRDMKGRIEADLARQGRQWGEVKSGAGSIRDVEFVTQYLQMAHGGAHPEVRSFNTLDALVRLADHGFLRGDEYRMLTDGYLFLRKIEHALQLMHYKQRHHLPDDPREQAYLARRLDYPDAATFLAHYERHCAAVRAVYERYIENEAPLAVAAPASTADFLAMHRALMEPSYAETFTEEQMQRHAELWERLSEDNLVEVFAEPRSDGLWDLTVAGFDHLGELSLICGLLYVYGFDIVAGSAFTAWHAEEGSRAAGLGTSTDGGPRSQRKYVDVFTVRPPLDVVFPEVWLRYRQDLAGLVRKVRDDKTREAQGELAKRVAGRVRGTSAPAPKLYPVEVQLDNTLSDRATVLHIRAEDTIGFLYELANALSMAGIHIWRVAVSSVGNRVFDTLYVTDALGEKITNPDRLQELRAAVVLIKHFTHLLPQSPNAEAALMHFRDFLGQLFQQEHWYEELASLERSEVLEALARLLGVSDFLWEDFLRLQHNNLFPVVKDVEALARRKPAGQLQRELDALLASAADDAQRREFLNAFKDREMFRIDMRHILGHIEEFGQFSAELTDVAEVVVRGALEIVQHQLRERFGIPQLAEGGECPLAVCALGKCGGRELGFASDIELMFIYAGDGRTTGPETITSTEFYQRLVEAFTHTIAARREGIFQIDLRLRPYGRAGSLAVSLDAFRQYFGPSGAAWPYERQALVKLRAIAGDPSFARRVEQIRDELVYTGEAFDAAAMRAMREKQMRQLVAAGTINAKLSPGGLVDVEYLVQGLQMTHGFRHPELRTSNTCEAMAALERAGILSADEHRRLLAAYVFLRRLIDALRMVRGHARDLTVPPADSEEFEFLARRLGYGFDTARLQADLVRSTEDVQELSRLLPAPGT